MATNPNNIKSDSYIYKEPCWESNIDADYFNPITGTYLTRDSESLGEVGDLLPNPKISSADIDRVEQETLTYQNKREAMQERILELSEKYIADAEDKESARSLIASTL